MSLVLQSLLLIFFINSTCDILTVGYHQADFPVLMHFQITIKTEDTELFEYWVIRRCLVLNFATPGAVRGMDETFLVILQLFDQ